MGPSSDRRRSLLSIVGGIVIHLALALSACSGGSESGSPVTTTTIDPSAPTTTDPLAPVPFSDPDVPVTIGLGRRFQLLLPADPARAWRWVLEPVDTAVVVPLSTEFLADPALRARASATTTSTTPTDPTPTNWPTSTTTPPATWIPTTTTTLDPNSPEAGPVAQVITFAGRSLATTTVRLRYEQIGAENRSPRTDTFTVTVQAVSPN